MWLFQVCLATLKLFDTLLQKEEEHIFHCLLLRNLLGRSYLQESPPTEDNSPQIPTRDDVSHEVEKDYSERELAPTANKLIIDIQENNATDASATTGVESSQLASSNPEQLTEQNTESTDAVLKTNSGSLTVDQCSVKPAEEVDDHNKDLSSQNEQTFTRELLNSSACKEDDGKDNSSPGSSNSSNVSSSGASVSSSLPSG